MTAGGGQVPCHKCGQYDSQLMGREGRQTDSAQAPGQAFPVGPLRLVFSSACLRTDLAHLL